MSGLFRLCNAGFDAAASAMALPSRGSGLAAGGVGARGVAALGIGGVAAWIAVQPASYVSEARLVASGRFRPARTRTLYREELSRFYETQLALMGSREVRARALAGLVLVAEDTLSVATKMDAVLAGVRLGESTAARSGQMLELLSARLLAMLHAVGQSPGNHAHENQVASSYRATRERDEDEGKDEEWRPQNPSD